jgi:spore coat protein SA
LQVESWGYAMIYHVLPEKEPFSAYSGGAVARDVANLMRYDSSSCVICPSCDDTWGFEPDRTIALPGWRKYARIKGRKQLPRWIYKVLLSRIFRPLVSLLKDGDIVWCHNQPYAAAALERTIHLKHAKVVSQYHDALLVEGRPSVYKSFTADASLFVSEFMRQEGLRLFPQLKHTYVLYNGADESLFYPSPGRGGRPNDTPVILYVGRLNPKKGVHVLIEAMRILQKRKIQAVCKVVGSSFFGGSKVTSYVRSLHMSCPSNVHFSGHCVQTEIALEYKAADILCCPSIWQEPFGNVNIEAMACGIPVVATRVGGIPEIASEGGVMLVKPNSAAELADALQKLVEDKKLRAEVGAKGLQSFQRNFTWAVIYGQWQKVFNRLNTEVG